jgi:hypothetical protein
MKDRHRPLFEQFIRSSMGHRFTKAKKLAKVTGTIGRTGKKKMS